MRNPRSGMSVVELLVAAGLATGVAFVGSYLVQRSDRAVKNAVVQSLRNTNLREEVSRAVRDAGKWIAYEKRADGLNGGSLSACLNPGGPFSCAPSDSTVTDAEILAEVPAGGGIVQMPLFIAVGAADDAASLSNLATDFSQIAGTEAAPLYLSDFGVVCTDPITKKSCGTIATAYFIRQYSGTTQDPGGVKFVIKLAANPALPTQGERVSPAYIRINVGTAWRGLADATGPIPVGTILPFAGATVPKGYLLCDGSEVSDTTYPKLAAVLRNAASTWGPSTGTSAGSGMFLLPDLRGVYLRGLDDGAGGTAVDPDRPRAIGSFQKQAMKDHAHTFSSIIAAMSPPTMAVAGSAPMTTTITGHTSSMTLASGGSFPSSGGGFEYAGSPSNGLTVAPGGTLTGTATLTSSGSVPLSGVTLGSNFVGLSGPTTTITAGGTGVEVRPPTASVQFIIRADY